LSSNTLAAKKLAPLVVNNIWKIWAVSKIDLKDVGNTSDNNLSVDCSSGLVEGSSRGQDASSNRGLDVDGSGSDDVVDNSIRWEVVSREGEISTSDNIDDPFTISSTSNGLPVIDGRDCGSINSDIVCLGVRVLASQGQGSIDNQLVNVVIQGGQEVGFSSVASLGIGESGIQVSSKWGLLGEQRCVVGGERSSDVGLASNWGKSTIQPDSVSSDDSSVPRVIGERGSDRKTSTQIEVSLDGKSSLNITGVCVEVSEGDDIVIQEGKRFSSGGELVSVAIDIEDGARIDDDGSSGGLSSCNCAGGKGWDSGGDLSDWFVGIDEGEFKNLMVSVSRSCS